jgi:flagellar secretion chaperone FliS
MFGAAQNGANAYAKVGMETGVTAATPHKLTVMLFDGALVAISGALSHMKAGNIPEKGQAISKAILIISSGLRASLNKEVGGQIALNLDALYQYMTEKLLFANLKNQPEALEEVHRLLSEIRDAWMAIDTTAQTTEQAPPPKMPAYDPLEPHISTLVKA